MRKHLLIALVIAAALTMFAVGLLAAPEADWYTGNEDPAIGDWDLDLTWDKAGPSGALVSRSGAQSTQGSYSYLHYEDCGIAGCSAAVARDCNGNADEGYIDVDFRFDSLLPGIATVNPHPFIAIGEWNGFVPPVTGAPQVEPSFFVYYHSSEKRARFRCEACNPVVDEPMGNIDVDTWYRFRISWDGVEDGGAAGEFTVQQDDTTWYDADTLSMQAGPTFDPPEIVSVGPLTLGTAEWHYVYSSDRSMYSDDVTIYGCDEVMPTPTPIPTAEPCTPYGNYAVVNVADDCSAVIRFEGLGQTIPITATINYVGLKFYGVAVEEPGETVTITPLSEVWGELTTTWCQRLMWTSWIEPGATDIPGDRGAVDVGTFETKLGWQQVELDKDILGVSWLLGIPNPGVILHNDAMTGRFSIASDWYDPVDSYGPELIVNWE